MTDRELAVWIESLELQAYGALLALITQPGPGVVTAARGSARAFVASIAAQYRRDPVTGTWSKV